MQVGVGYCDNPDSAAAGQLAALEALKKAGRSDPCDFVLLFCTARHDQVALREAVATTVGNSQFIFGGGAVGIITNDAFGYAGDQVGIACVWMDDSNWTALCEGGLLESEFATGLRLGEKLAELNISPDSSVMLFYDAVDQCGNDLRLLMATWILEGLEKGLGFLPQLTGAGMQGDHICTPTQQYIGDRIDHHHATAMTFSDDIRIDSIILHGCRPASPYYTVTKAEGSKILEINGQPALSFMDDLLGPALTPDDYPFFLLFGINYGEDEAKYSEENYASRLCLGIDRERGGIIMFEPDMVMGTRFQVMFRTLDLQYMEPRIQELFDKVEDREQIFAIYIDCAGRCAGYGGVEMEDAYIVQKAVKDRIPLLGLYTGVEIGSIAGKPRGLDWTGVFCIFSKSKDGKVRKVEAEAKPSRDDIRPANRESSISPNSMVQLLEQNVAKILSLDVQTIAIRHELEQKRRGFSLLAELSVSLRQVNSSESIFLTAATRINAALNMQKTAVLLLDKDGKFVPAVLQGFTVEEKEALAGQRIVVGLEMSTPIMVTAADDDVYFAEMRRTLKLPYFISIPIIVENKVAAILITGRMMEASPFLSRLTRNDIETVQAISALLASILVHQRLDNMSKLAQTDALTGLLNRGAFEFKVKELLMHELPEGRTFAFLMIDCDYFKKINDNFGHPVGDKVLKLLAKMFRNNFRTTDLIARMGGDEFAILCSLNGNAEGFKGRIANLAEAWVSTPIKPEGEISFHSTISIGIATAPNDGSVYEDLLNRADIALYKSKELGRNQCSMYGEIVGNLGLEN